MGHRIFSFIFNKYLITFIAFVLWISIFDKDNLGNQLRLYRQMKALQREKAYYIDEIKKDQQATLELKSDQRNLEKFGRETYQMKKDSETVYLIINEDQPLK